MLTQVRFLYESELKKVNERCIKQVLQKMSPVDTSSTRSKPQEAVRIINNNLYMYIIKGKLFMINHYESVYKLMKSTERQTIS